VKEREEGFTLLELVVAVTILSLSLLAIYQASARGLRVLHRVDQLSLASMIARSKLAELAANGSEINLPGEGQDASGFIWRISPAPSPPDTTNLKVITVEVFSATDSESPIFSVATALYQDTRQ
jgi:general secretion pathway protein I